MAENQTKQPSKSEAAAPARRASTSERYETYRGADLDGKRRFGFRALYRRNDGPWRRVDSAAAYDSEDAAAAAAEKWITEKSEPRGEDLIPRSAVVL